MVLFYRNTHIGPEFTELRSDLDNYGVTPHKPTREALGTGASPHRGAAFGFFLLHFLSHTEGKTFDQLVDEVRKYEEEFPELKPGMHPEDFFTELHDSVNLSLIRVEEVAG